MKRKLAYPAPIANPTTGLPLFEMAERARVHRLPLSVQRLARRFNLPAATAVTYAELIGFNVTEAR
jgi:hypothetical protein